MSEIRDYVIRKNGYFYRPPRNGYTSSIAEAARYTKAEAEAEARIEKSITAHHESEFHAPEPSELSRLRAEVARLLAENEQLRRDLKMAIDMGMEAMN